MFKFKNNKLIWIINISKKDKINMMKYSKKILKKESMKKYL